MGRGRPQPQVGDDLPDDLGLVKKGHDAHRAPTPRTTQGIGLIDFLDELGPALCEGRRDRGWKVSADSLPYQSCEGAKFGA